MTNILIAFYSRTGTTEKLANAVAEGARSAGADVRLRRAREVVGEDVMKLAPGWLENAKRMNEAYEAPTAADAEWADGVVFGTPTRFGTVTSELKAWIDGLGGLWAKGALNGKAGSVFSSTSTAHGGNEATILTLYPALAHLGFVIVPTGYADAALYKAGTPYGATSISGQNATPPSPEDLEVARFQGKRVAQVAEVLASLRQ